VQDEPTLWVVYPTSFYPMLRATAYVNLKYNLLFKMIA